MALLDGEQLGIAHLTLWLSQLCTTWTAYFTRCPTPPAGRSCATLPDVSAPSPSSLSRTKCPSSRVSKHLKVLEDARLIRRRKDGSFHYLRLNPEALQTADEWIRRYEQFWSPRLDSLRSRPEQEDT